MRAVIHRDNVKIEFSGRGQVWNELLRPYLGGPEAPPEPLPAQRPVTSTSTTTSTVPAQPVARSQPIAAERAAQSQLPVPTRPAASVTAAHPAAPALQPAASGYGAAPAVARPPASQPRTWYPPRPQTPQRFEPRYPVAPSSADGADESDAIRVEPSADPATLYARLAAIPGRRSERDAVLAAVWFLTHGEREATADDVESHFDSLGVFPDLKVVPSLLKHVHRTKMFEQGSTPKSVRFSKKGIAGVRGRLVPV